MSSHLHKRSNTIASAAWVDYSRFIVPADTEVLYKLGACSFKIEQREKMIPKLSFIYKMYRYMRKDINPQLRLLLIYRPQKDDWLSGPEYFWVNNSKLFAS